MEPLAGEFALADDVFRARNPRGLAASKPMKERI